MTFYEALEVMKRGRSVRRNGKTFAIGRGGILDVTKEEAPDRVTIGKDERQATDWEAAS